MPKPKSRVIKSKSPRSKPKPRVIKKSKSKPRVVKKSKSKSPRSKPKPRVVKKSKSSKSSSKKVSSKSKSSVKPKVSSKSKSSHAVDLTSSVRKIALQVHPDIGEKFATRVCVKKMTEYAEKVLKKLQKAGAKGKGVGDIIRDAVKGQLAIHANVAAVKQIQAPDIKQMVQQYAFTCTQSQEQAVKAVTGVIDYLFAEILELAGNHYRENDGRSSCTTAIETAVKHDSELSELLR